MKMSGLILEELKIPFSHKSRPLDWQFSNEIHFEQIKINGKFHKKNQDSLFDVISSLMYNLFVTSKNETTNSPIHEFEMLQNVFQSL